MGSTYYYKVKVKGHIYTELNLNLKSAQSVRSGKMASLAEELECEADDDLTKDIASLKAALSENVASASPGIR